MKRARKALGVNNAATAAESAIDTAAEQQKLEEARRCQYGRVVVTVEQVNDALRKKTEHEATILDPFLHAATHVTKSTRSFTFEDIGMLLRPYQFEPKTLKALFDEWTTLMVEWSKLQKLQGAYDQFVFVPQ